MALINKKERIQKAIMIAIVAFFIYGFEKYYLSDVIKNKHLEITLKKLAKNINDECPHIYYDELVLEKVYFANKKTIEYYFKYLNYMKSDFDLQQLKEDSIEAVIVEIESIELLATLRNKDVIFEYIYFDNQNEEIFKIKLLFNTPIKIIESEVSEK